MNPRSPDNPDLTTYALGELTPEQEQEMRALLAAEPEARAELAGIEQIAEALHHGSPIPMDHLTPRQRYNVLTPPKGPRIVTPMMPRQPVTKRESPFKPVLATLFKLAAVGTLTTGAFMLGRQTDSTSVSVQTAAAPTIPSPSKTETPQLKSKPVTPLLTTAPVEPQVATVKPEPLTVAVAPPQKIEVKPQPELAIPVPTLAKTEAPKQSGNSFESIGYTPTNRNPISRVELRPFETRPAPVKADDRAMASPNRSAPEEDPRNEKNRIPELMVHSWKAEVASCPWNPDHKLLRILVQLPADQLASTSPKNVYPLQISFDALAVRSFRMLSESHVPPEKGANAAAHVMWYEVVPSNPNAEINRESGRSLATVTVPNAKFSSQAVGPFVNSSKLQALDRGQKWENAREDFLFETAIVGFGLLMRGEDNLGSLNHELVMKMAEKAQGTSKTDDKRAQFIRLVQDARRMTGI
jgi:anti-sigma factor RsiW